MAAEYSYQPRTVNHASTSLTTSIDCAKKGSFTTTSIAGSKRLFDAPGFNERLSRSNGNHQGDAFKASKIVRCSSQPDENVHTYRPGSTPSITQHPLLSLAHSSYDLPPKLVDNFAALGVRAIYPWQSSCLVQSGALSQSRNLVYTAPTGGGKSLVADVVLLKKVIDHPSSKAILVLPYVALVQEKAKSLRRLVQGLQKEVGRAGQSPALQKSVGKEIIVAPFYGGSKSKVSWSGCDVAVCTIEKANMLINSAIEEGSIGDLGIVVCDELHMLDDEYRGYILELMLTKILTLQLGVQIIGMSATLEHPEVLARWLQAKFFVARYRPIPIRENLVYENAIYPSADSKDFLRTASQLSSEAGTQKPKQPTHMIEQSCLPELSSPVVNAVVALAIEIAEEGYGALVFCSSRASTQSIASLIAKAMQPALFPNDVAEQRLDVMASLQALPGGFEPSLSHTIPRGVGFHHAGLTLEEREIIAEAYDSGSLKVIVATCSLAAGINLPARRVILNGARMGRDMVGAALLRQMRGRAGRKGKDEIGETFLCCKKSELEAVAELLEAELPGVTSCLSPEKRGIKRAVLEVLSIRMLSTYDGLQEYAQNSLLWHTSENHKMILDMLDAAILSLLKDKLIEVSEFDTYTPTGLGNAIVASGLAPEDGLFVHGELRQALSCFVMDSELHLLYLFTPIPQPAPKIALTQDISWTTFRSLLEQLDDPSLRALRLIGINLALVNRLANDGTENLPETTADEIRTARIYRRAYSTFALRDICNEIPISQIALDYGLPRGTIQNIASTCHGFAAGMIKFCQRIATPVPCTDPNRHNSHALSGHSQSLPSAGTPFRRAGGITDSEASGFSMLAAVLEHMQSRLYASARSDLLELAQVTFVKGRMARLLYESGFKSVRALGEADAQKEILPIMMQVQGWKLKQIEMEVSRETDVKDKEKMYETRRLKLEETLLRKAQVMVASAAKIYERDVLRTVDFEEE